MRRAAILCGLLVLAAGPAVGQRLAGNAELPALQAEYRDEQVRARRLRNDAIEAAQALEDLERQLVGLKAAEASDDVQLNVQRERLARLNRREAELVAGLAEVQAGQGRLLSGLQMLSREPPPPLLIPADRAVDTVRAAILMRAMAPELDARAQAAVRRQQEMARVRRLAVLSSERLLTVESAQGDRRSEIESLRTRKAALTAVLRADARRSETAARALEARILALGGRPTSAPEAEDVAVTRLPAGRSRLSAPSSGSPERVFGKGSNGVTWRGPVRAITAPAAGVVDYAGPLSGWGQVVIVDLGPGWRAVIAGLDTVSVEAGAHVSDGQALGRSAEDGEIYFELRRADRPIDPRPWLQ